MCSSIIFSTVTSLMPHSQLSAFLPLPNSPYVLHTYHNKLNVFSCNTIIVCLPAPRTYTLGEQWSLRARVCLCCSLMYSKHLEQCSTNSSPEGTKKQTRAPCISPHTLKAPEQVTLAWECSFPLPEKSEKGGEPHKLECFDSQLLFDFLSLHNFSQIS